MRIVHVRQVLLFSSPEGKLHPQGGYKNLLPPTFLSRRACFQVSLRSLPGQSQQTVEIYLFLYLVNLNPDMCQQTGSKVPGVGQDVGVQCGSRMPVPKGRSLGTIHNTYGRDRLLSHLSFVSARLLLIWMGLSVPVV